MPAFGEKRPTIKELEDALAQGRGVDIAPDGTVTEKTRGDPEWENAACLTIAETGQRWGDSVHPSPAMRAVYDLYHRNAAAQKVIAKMREVLAECGVV